MLAAPLSLTSDEAAVALFSSFANGALANLQNLILCENKIGDDGLSALASACANGALASLAALAVDNEEHPELKAACQARGIEFGVVY